MGRRRVAAVCGAFFFSAVAVGLVLAPGGVARAADYWVKNGGSDTLDGLSVAHAWATLNHAAGLVNPGDTVHVLDGSYQGFDLRRSGTAANPITFKAEASSAQITADNGKTPDGINVENAAYIVIDGFVVNNRTRAGIRVAVSQFVTVKNCHTGNNGTWGIFSGFADDLTIENNETHHSQTQHGIYVSNTCTRPIVRDNDVHDNYANGIHMNGDESEGGAGIITNALVERNVIHGNGVGGGSGINMDGVQSSVIQNNLLYDNHASGVSFYRIDASAGASNNLLINNTIIVASDGRWAVNINTGSTGNTVRNNVLYNLHSWHGAISIDASSRPGFHSDHNAVISRFSTDGGDTVLSLSAWQALGYDSGSFVTTPAALFVNPTSDFHLLPTAPAIDAGSATGAPTVDLDGNTRPAGAAVDVGAYEFQLLHCGDGHVDPHEQCGEPGLGCSDPCTTCLQCSCVPATPVCGDGNVCGNEQCEQDADCGPGAFCQGCQCMNTPVCTSGIVLERPTMTLKASPASLRLTALALVPKPWTAVDPLTNGVRVVVDALSGPGGIDVTIPGGSAWHVNQAHTQWVYVDRSGAIGGITRLTVTDRSHVTDGLLRVSIQGRGGSVALPPVEEVRTTLVVGAADECGSVVWNPPGSTPPRCQGSATRLTCR